MKFKSMIIIFLFSATLFGKTNDNTSNKRLAAIQTSIKEEKSKDYDKAIKTMLSIYTDNRADYLVNLRLGWLYYLNKKNDESLKFYKKAAKLSNNSIESMLGSTYPYSAEGNWDSVKTIYKKIIALDNFNYTANLKLGEIYINSKEYEKAKVLLEKIHKIYPSDYQANLELGWVYYYQGKMGEANYLFTNTLALDPKNESAEKGIGLTK